MAEENVRFSVITATYDAATVLPRLIRSLQAQTDKAFEWVVADGASRDATLALLQDAADTLQIRIDSRPDFGIYDALNRAVKLAAGEYYLVVGADDELFPDTIAKFKQAALDATPDLISAKVLIGDSIFEADKHQREWLHGAFAHVGSHAVGLAIRKSLHLKYSYYSNKFPIAADLFFILTAVHGGATVIRLDLLAGKFDRTGLSGRNPLGVLTEQFRIQVLMGHNIFVQLLLFSLRILKHRRRLLGIL